MSLAFAYQCMTSSPILNFIQLFLEVIQKIPQGFLNCPFCSVQPALLWNPLLISLPLKPLKGTSHSHFITIHYNWLEQPSDAISQAHRSKTFKMPPGVLKGQQWQYSKRSVKHLLFSTFCQHVSLRIKQYCLPVPINNKLNNADI